MGQLADEARRLSAGRVLHARWVGENADTASPTEVLLTNISCIAHGAGCWLPVPKEWYLPSSVTVNYIAMLCVEGGAEYRIGDDTYPLRAGELLLCPPNVRRSGRRDTTERFALYSVHFQVRFYGVLDLAALYPLPVAVRPPAAVHEQMVNTAERIIKEIGNEEPGYVLAADAACTELFALIVRGSDGPRSWSHATTAGILRLTPAFRLIDDRFSESLTLRQLAGVVGLEPTYFSAYFKKVVGTSPMRYLARYRLARARELLATTDLSLTAIAHRTGFGDAAYLSRVFRASEGTTPGEYRRTQESTMLP